jgi:ABC-2 type transport system permease protein
VLILSGYVYELRSAPAWIQALSHVIAGRYFVAAIQTLFQAGNVWAVLWPNLLFPLAAAIFFLGLTALKTRRSLE